MKKLFILLSAQTYHNQFMCKGYYRMEVNAINNIGFGATLQAPLAKRAVNRSLLKAPKSELKALCGPAEVKMAKAAVAAYSTGNAGLAALTAQAPGFDEVALSGVEIGMATYILNGIYKFDLSKNALKIIGTGLAGHKIGTSTFRWLSKTVTWFPLAGNALNAFVAGTTTATLGAALIQAAEFMDKQRKQGKTMDEVLNALQDFIKKMKM